MMVNITVGIMSGREGHKPIMASYVGTTANWPMESFHKYDWYRLTVKIPSNMGRPKIMGWRKIIHQEEKK